MHDEQAMSLGLLGRSKIVEGMMRCFFKAVDILSWLQSTCEVKELGSRLSSRKEVCFGQSYVVRMMELIENVVRTF